MAERQALRPLEPFLPALLHLASGSRTSWLVEELRAYAVGEQYLVRKAGTFVQWPALGSRLLFVRQSSKEKEDQWLPCAGAPCMPSSKHLEP